MLNLLRLFESDESKLNRFLNAQSKIFLREYDSYKRRIISDRIYSKIDSVFREVNKRDKYYALWATLVNQDVH